jgi:hypothetical protein
VTIGKSLLACQVGRRRMDATNGCRRRKNVWLTIEA